MICIQVLQVLDELAAEAQVAAEAAIIRTMLAEASGAEAAGGSRMLPQPQQGEAGFCPSPRKSSTLRSRTRSLTRVASFRWFSACRSAKQEGAVCSAGNGKWLSISEGYQSQMGPVYQKVW